MRNLSPTRTAAAAALIGAGLVTLIGFTHWTTAAELKQARVTQVIKDVKLLPGQAAPRPAAVNDTVSHDSGVRTGADSRTELTFADQTITRLGANTIFSFEAGTRNVELGSGALLLAVPKGAGGATIKTAAVSASVTGTTVMFEYHSKGPSKYIVLEGTSRVCRNKRIREPSPSPSRSRSPSPSPSADHCRDMRAGDILVFDADALGLPGTQKVDLKKLVGTAGLITQFRPLPTLSLIQQEIENQQSGQPGGGGLVDPTGLDERDRKRSIEQPPTPPPPTPQPPVVKG